MFGLPPTHPCIISTTAANVNIVVFWRSDPHESWVVRDQVVFELRIRTILRLFRNYIVTQSLTEYAIIELDTDAVSAVRQDMIVR